METLQQRFEETTIDGTLRNSNKEAVIILDSCVQIKSRKHKSHLLTVLAGKMGRYGAQLVLPRIVIHEISKVTRSSKHTPCDTNIYF